MRSLKTRKPVSTPWVTGPWAPGGVTSTVWAWPPKWRARLEQGDLRPTAQLVRGAQTGNAGTNDGDSLADPGAGVGRKKVAKRPETKKREGRSAQGFSHCPQAGKASQHQNLCCIKSGAGLSKFQTLFCKIFASAPPTRRAPGRATLPGLAPGQEWEVGVRIGQILFCLGQ